MNDTSTRYANATELATALSDYLYSNQLVLLVNDAHYYISDDYRAKHFIGDGTEIFFIKNELFRHFGDTGASVYYGFHCHDDFQPDIYLFLKDYSEYIEYWYSLYMQGGEFRQLVDTKLV